jgi:hypothetical protein
MTPQAARVTIIGEEIFVQSGEMPDRDFLIFIPVTSR